MTDHESVDVEKLITANPERVVFLSENPGKDEFIVADPDATVTIGEMQ